MTLSSEKVSLPEVDSHRWKTAQQWELQFWRRQNIPGPLWKRLLRPILVFTGFRSAQAKSSLDDRNHWWARQFDEYADLPLHFENLCELGCGPYTNTRLILQGRTARYIHLSDPLAAEYVKFPNAWLAMAYRAVSVMIDHHPTEECPFRDDYFDLTIMINVLDHVRDPALCLNQAFRITRPGGYFVFGQDLTGPDDEKPGNPGHTILLDHEQLDGILLDRFDVLRRRILPRDAGLEPAMHYGTYIFVGKKRNP